MGAWISSLLCESKPLRLYAVFSLFTEVLYAHIMLAVTGVCVAVERKTGKLDCDVG